ncbi:MAG: hypothetical protein SH856_04430 [Flavobacteriales bacterium]|nr:hypothetical protein [Flavobacteriales bacterium]
MDFAPLFKKNKVRTQTTKEISYRDKIALDTLITGIAEFDVNGRMISFKEFFARGRHYATYSYQYDAEGKIYSASIEHVFADFRPINFTLTYDTKGRVIERLLQEPIRNFWMKETYNYNSAGILVKSEQWYDRDGKLEALSNKTHPGSIIRDERSLTNLYDQHELPLLRKYQSVTSGLDISVVYAYERF